ncbi:MAG: hypothetical protein ACFB16_03545 [Phormidesmis sp.]
MNSLPICYKSGSTLDKIPYVQEIKDWQEWRPASDTSIGIVYEECEKGDEVGDRTQQSPQNSHIITAASTEKSRPTGKLSLVAYAP